MQRFLDIVFSLAGLLILFPFMIVVGLVIKLSDGGTVFYLATRVGKEGVPFTLLKFRTMRPDADKLGAGITTAGDKRITPVGRFLRSWKLDELPQLVNVLMGDMTFVGARPEDPRFVQLYTQSQKEILSFKPGITSPASLYYRNEEQILDSPNWQEQYVRTILPHKLSLDLAYLQERSTLGDVRIVLQTLGRVLS